MKTISLKSSLHRWEAIHVKAQNTSFVFFQIFCSLKYLLCAQQKEASFYLTGRLRSLTSGFLYMAELNFSCSQCPAYFFLMQISLSKLQMNIWSKVSSFLFYSDLIKKFLFHLWLRGQFDRKTILMQSLLALFRNLPSPFLLFWCFDLYMFWLRKLFTYLKFRIRKENETERERENIFYLLIHSLKGLNSQD